MDKNATAPSFCLVYNQTPVHIRHKRSCFIPRPRETITLAHLKTGFSLPSRLDLRFFSQPRSFDQLLELASKLGWNSVLALGQGTEKERERKEKDRTCRRSDAWLEFCENRENEYFASIARSMERKRKQVAKFVLFVGILLGLDCLLLLSYAFRSYSVSFYNAFVWTNSERKR